MAYAIKLRKGIKLQSGRTTRGGVIRTLGNRTAIFPSKKLAQKTWKHHMYKKYKNPQKRKKAVKAVIYKKI